MYAKNVVLNLFPLEIRDVIAFISIPLLPNVAIWQHF